MNQTILESPCTDCTEFWYNGKTNDSCLSECLPYKIWSEEKIGVYLAGGIDLISPDEAVLWRKAATGFLEPLGFEIFDPTVGKDLYAPGINTTHYTPEQIVKADLHMIKKSKILLVEINRKDKPYHGTSMELVYAHLWGKEIVVWGGCQSYWVRYHATEIFETLDEALEYMAKIYGTRRLA